MARRTIQWHSRRFTPPKHDLLRGTLTRTALYDQVMSTQAAIAPSPKKLAHPASIAVTRMTVGDIPAVMEIEKEAFPRPWPEKAYRYELAENSNAYFVVARTAHVPEPAVGLLSRLTSLLTQRAHAHPAQPAKPDTPARATIVGFAGMWMYVDEAHIATIATHPEWRGRGIGELILHNLMREAQRRQAVSVTLEVRVSNTVAQRLYHKYGFEEVGRRKAYYQDNREDALLMTVTNFQEPDYRAQLDVLEQHLKAS